MAGGTRKRRPKNDGSQRYAESRQAYERRQRRDQLVGTLGLVVFGFLLVANLILEMAPDLPLLPGGHSELYFVAAVAGVAYSAWIRFDLGLTRRKRR